MIPESKIPKREIPNIYLISMRATLMTVAFVILAWSSYKLNTRSVNATLLNFFGMGSSSVGESGRKIRVNPNHPD